jgi:Signal peptidase, peptidase S26
VNLQHTVHLIDTLELAQQFLGFPLVNLTHCAAMEFLRQLLLYGILIIVFWGGIVLMKSLARVDVPLGYSDVRDLPEFTSYRADQTVRFANYQIGDGVCFRLGTEEDLAINFGWVAGLPGDSVSVANGQLLINGNPAVHGEVVPLSNCGPIQIPRDHLFIVTDQHQRDSVKYGSLPASALIGRIGRLP